MKNACAISSLARQLGKVSEKLDSLAMGVQDVEQNAPDLTDVYQGLLLDEIEHVQILTLELTKAGGCGRGNQRRRGRKRLRCRRPDR